MSRELTREMIEEWRDHPVTERLLLTVKERKEGAISEVMGSANSSDFDNLVKGLFKGLTEVEDWIAEIRPDKESPEDAIPS